MAETYKGIVKEGVVVLPQSVQLADGLEVAVVVLSASGESPEDLAWAALSAEAWGTDWVDEDRELVEGN
jgi:fructoselysine-6-P-deglycase FrlB-like protein